MGVVVCFLIKELCTSLSSGIKSLSQNRQNQDYGIKEIIYNKRKFKYIVILENRYLNTEEVVEGETKEEVLEEIRKVYARWEKAL